MKKLFTLALLVVNFFILFNNAQAQMYLGSDLTYECIGGNDYVVTYTYYRDCDCMVPSASVPIQIICTSNSQYNFNTTLQKKSGINGLEITHACNLVPTKCASGTNLGVEEWIYEGQVYLPPCNSWKISRTMCCRYSINTTTQSSPSVYIEAILNNLQAPNSSPTLSNTPLVLVGQGNSVSYNNGAIDIDGDSLSYEFILPKTSETATVNYISGYSHTQPIISNPPISLNPVTGDISMTPTTSIHSPTAILIKEWREVNGVMTNIGSVIRDIRLNVESSNNNLPILSGIDNLLTHTYNPNDTIFYKDVNVGAQITFDINGFDADTFNASVSGNPEKMSISWNNGIAGGTFSAYNNNTDSAYANFSWTPTSADVSNNPHCFTATVQDQACAYNGVNTFSYCFRVKSSQTSNYAGSDLTYFNIGGNNYVVTFALYHDCSDGSEPDSIGILFRCSSNNQLNFFKNLHKKSGPNGMEVTPSCTNAPSSCFGGTTYGVREWVYEGEVTLTPCNSWKMSYTSCCRNTNDITTGTGVYTEFMLNNLIAPANNSPIYSDKPIMVTCQNHAVCYSNGALDADGDSLSYEFISPRTSENTNVIYGSGLTYSQPLYSISPVSLNPLTGDICFTPAFSNLTITAVKISEWRTINGIPTIIGTYNRDLQFKVLPCQNELPVLSGMDTSLTHTYNSNDTSFFAEIFIGNLFSFDINGFDPDTLDTLVVGHPEIMTISWNNGIPAGTFTPYYNGTDSAYANFSWTPVWTDVSNTPQCFVATVQDDACPYMGTNSFSYCMLVKSGIGINENKNSLIDKLNIYPNPFCDELNIEYYLSKNSNVKIELFNLLGKQIKLVQNKYQSSGKHSLKLNSTENNLRKGIYILKISSENFEINKKLISN